MSHPFLPYLLLVIAPLAFAAYSLRSALSPAVRWTVALILFGLALLKFPFEGFDYLSLKRIDLFLSGGMVVALLFRHLGVAWWQDSRHYGRFLAGMAVAAAMVYLNFFAFHGSRAYIHHHDVAHYYLGSKYFHEVGYGNLYVAMARAEAEEFGGTLVSAKVRDLERNFLVPIERVLSASDAVRSRFSAERWAAFRADVRYFREAMGAAYAGVLQDHGYNPTPVWTLIGGPIANLVPAGSARGIFILTLFDPLLLVAALVAVRRVFGREAQLLAVVYFCIAFGAAFTWFGGSFLRCLSFAAIVGAACCLGRGRHGWAGVLLALATMLRVFPLFLAVGPAFQALQRWLETRRWPRSEARFVIAFAGTAAALFIASAATPEGLAPWVDFYRNTSGHMKSVSSNILGLTNLPSYLRGIDVTAPGGLEAFLAWRETVQRLQLGVVFPIALGLVWVLSRRVGSVEAMAAGSLLVFTAINIAAYYYTFLVVLVLVLRHRPRALMAVFAVELVVYSLHLFEDHEVLLYLYKNASLFYLFVFLGVEQWTIVRGQPEAGTVSPRYQVMSSSPQNT